MSSNEGTPVGERLGSERLYEQSVAPVAAETMPPVGRGSLFAVSEPPATPKAEKVAKPVKQAKQPPAPVKDGATQRKWADLNWRGYVSSLLELLGIAAITAGCALIAPYLALIVGGILLVVLGVATGFDVTK